MVRGPQVPNLSPLVGGPSRRQQKCIGQCWNKKSGFQAAEATYTSLVSTTMPLNFASHLYTACNLSD